MMRIDIHRLPAFRDNYLFLLHAPESQEAAVVDPGDAQVVIQAIEQLGASLTAILNTHHHLDHVGGNQTLLKHYPQAVVYGGADDRGRLPGQSVFLRGGDRVAWAGAKAEVLFVPGHTRSHIAYYFPAQGSGAETATIGDERVPCPAMLGERGDLFCGDTLFSGGCGRLFEGTPEQMWQSLQQLRALSGTTRVWCAHEYTLDNLRFAVTVDPQNVELRERYAWVQAQRAQGHATIPAVLGREVQTNPFLRCDRPEIQTALGTDQPVRAFAKLRGKKDLF